MDIDIGDTIKVVIAVVLGALLAGALYPIAISQLDTQDNSSWANTCVNDSLCTDLSNAATVSTIWNNGMTVMAALAGMFVFVAIVIRVTK